MGKRKLSVFLSYAAGDVAAAQTLYERLTAEGWMNIWFGEQQLGPGVDTNLEIEKAISRADLAIIFISKNAANQAGIFQKQLRLILDAAQNMPEGAIFILPLRLEECEPPFVLRHLQFGSYFENEREQAYLKMLGSLRTRAAQLKISAKASAENAATQGGTTPSVSIGGDVKADAIISGNNNRVTIIHKHIQHEKDEDMPETTDS